MHCCFHFFLSYLLHFHISPNRARELEANCCSFSVQQFLEVCRPSSTLPYFLLLYLITAPFFAFLPSSVLYIPCHLEYHLFATIFVKLSRYSSVLCPPPSCTWLPSSSGNTGALNRWVFALLCLYAFYRFEKKIHLRRQNKL